MTNAIKTNPRKSSDGSARDERLTTGGKQASDVAYNVHSILRTCVCALNTDLNLSRTFGDNSDGVSKTLEMAENLMGDLIDRIEALESANGPGGKS